LGDSKPASQEIISDVFSDVDLEQMATVPIEVLPEPEVLVESQLADELDIVATYIPSEDADSELWSEFSDFFH
jgi:hypothetical protein